MSLSANRELGLPDFSHPGKVDLNWSKGYANLTSILVGLIVDNLEGLFGRDTGQDQNPLPSRAILS